ncbi:tail fiber protein [Microvirga antarctica]|uniref:tail fiber protein n=1 Tax=Microvirga antarctica TaxID=2819233 RepID=UPI001B30FD6B|nr:tail fiber protein [Microvirga antarctica]
MSLIIADRVRETSTTTGTGALTLLGGVSGFQGFATAMAIGDSCWYAIAGGAQWETGQGILTAANTLSRTTVFASSSAGSLVNFAAGSKDVYMTLPAKALQGALTSLIPPGAEFAYGGDTPPPGFLFPYGQNVSRAANPKLFAVYGTKYGAGDGSTTFGMPDYRGRAPFGRDDMGGIAAGRITSGVSGIVGSLLGAGGGSESMQIHTHPVSATYSEGANQQHTHATRFKYLNASLTATPGGDVVILAVGNARGTTYDVGTAAEIPDHAHFVSGQTATSTGGGNSQNMPPALIRNWIIFTGNLS